MQNNIPITILQEGYENLKNSLLSNLEGKAKFISDAHSTELSQAKLFRITSEEKHIRLCIGTTDAAENLIKALEEQVQKLTEEGIIKDRKLEYFYAEAMHYMKLYYEK